MTTTPRSCKLHLETSGQSWISAFGISLSPCCSYMASHVSDFRLGDPFRLDAFSTPALLESALLDSGSRHYAWEQTAHDVVRYFVFSRLGGSVRVVH